MKKELRLTTKLPKRLSACLVCLALMLCSFCALGQVAIDKTKWRVVFEDDFNDPTTIVSDPALITDSTKWVSYYRAGEPVLSNEDNGWAYTTPANIVVQNGFANIYVRDLGLDPANWIFYAPYNRTYRYTSGVLTSTYNDAAYSGCNVNSEKVDATGALYGMFEIRCKMPKGNNHSSAFWMVGAKFEEADVFEYDGRASRQFTNNIHWPIFGQNGVVTHGECQNTFDKASPGDLADDYHIYTLVWTPTALTYFFDGREVRTDTRPDHVPDGCDWRRMITVIDSEVWGNSIGNPAGNPVGPYTVEDLDSPFSIDYYRLYKPVSNNHDNNLTNNADQLSIYNSTPYMQSTALNTINYIGGNAQVARHNVGICNSPNAASVPTREIDTDYEQIQTVGISEKVFYRTENNYMMVIYHDQNGWHDVGTNWAVQNVAGNVTCSKTAGTVSVYYSDEQGRMFYFSHNGGWQSTCMNENVFNVSNNVVATNQPSGWIAYRNTSGGLSQFTRVGSQWHSTDIYGGGDVSSCMGAVATLDDYIFFKTTSNRLYYIQQNSNGWGTPVLVSAVTDVGNSLTLTRNPANAGLNGYRVNYIGTNNIVYNAYLENGLWVNYMLDWRINNAASNLIMAENQIYYRGTDNKLWNHYYYEGAWRVAPINYNYKNSPLVASGLCMGAGGKVHFVDADRSVYNAWPQASQLVDQSCSTDFFISNRVASAPDETTTSQGSTSLGKAMPCTKIIVYNAHGTLLKELPYQDNTTAKSLGLTTGFYIIRSLDQRGHLLKTEKIMVVD